jgi:hypothetical protein
VTAVGLSVRVYSASTAEAAGTKRPIRVPIRGTMPLVSFLRVFRVAFCAAALSLTATAALAQTGAPKPPEQQKPPGETAKDGQKSIDEIAEASRVLQGPAGNPECVWLGRRVVSLMWRDDLDTAFRHLDLYDRFGCPGGHVQAAFRCLTRFGGQIDPKVAETLSSRIHACWINPGAQPQQAATAGPAPAAPATAGNAAQAPAPTPAPTSAPTAPAK